MKKTAIITGAAGGIGSACAGVFASMGYAVVLADIAEKPLSALAASFAAEGKDALAVPGNLEDEACWASVVEKAVERYGRIDVLVNNAAWRVLGSLRTCTLDQWERTLRVCLTAPVFLSKKVAEVMEATATGGVIVNVSSMMADRPSGLGPAYIAAKGALDSLTKELAVTYGRSGIRVVGVAPGYIDTELSNDYKNAEGVNISDVLTKELTDFVPLGRGGSANEVASVIAWLCSDAAAYISGTTLLVDGGFSPNFSSYPIKKLQYPDEF